ncbi:MAG TPA: ATP-binding protein, partial [Candidatus Methylomirabilis sp.]|nr:ATP-binding protein [Candidatus Methylomirabilis sp.]
LDLAKVEAGRFVLEPEAMDLAATLEDILVIARGLAHQKAQQIEVQIEPSLAPLRADPVRFKQICFNLLSNAVKFTPEQGRIIVAARRAPEGGDWLELRVTDTGTGINAEELPRLFQEFVQLEAAATKRHEGTGLGLALTKRLVELHGGQIRAESAGLGQGSTFTVLLPFGGPGESWGALTGAPSP